RRNPGPVISRFCVASSDGEAILKSPGNARNCGDEHEARPRENEPPAGATDAGDTLPTQALPIGRAANRVPPSDLPRISPVFFPAPLASASTFLTSAGVETVVPPTSRITSPVLKPRSAAGPSGSTCVTTTPCPDAPATCLAGASERPSLGTSAP